jgi:hypothetical protein
MSAYLPDTLLDELGTAIGQRIKAVRDLIGIGGGAALSGQTTIILPSTGGIEHIQTVAAAGVTPANRIMVTLAPHEDGDENHELWLDLVALTGRAGNDQITILAAFSTRTAGPVKLIWSAL